MSKEILENKKSVLELMLSENGDQCIDFKAQLATIEQELKDLGKIALPPVVFDDIHEAVEAAIGEFDFSDEDNFDKEFDLDYDNRITLSNLELTNTTDLVEMIVEKISKLFLEAEDEELDTTKVDNHA